jgi:hypothetical protein
MNRLDEHSVRTLGSMGLDLEVRRPCPHGCKHCEAMERASKATLCTEEKLWGGWRPGAGRRPSTVQGYLKRLPFNVARTLERRFLAELESVFEAVHVREQTGVELEPDLNASGTERGTDGKESA